MLLVFKVYVKPVWWWALKNSHCLPQKNSNSTQLYFMTFCCSGGRGQLWAKVQAPAGYLAITSNVYSRRHLKVLVSWGSAPANPWLVWLARTNTGCFPVRGNSCGQLQAHFTNRKKCCHSCNTDSVWESMLCKFLVVISFFSMQKWKYMDFERTFYKTKQSSSLGSIFQSFVVLLVKIRYQTKSGCHVNVFT